MATQEQIERTRKEYEGYAAAPLEAEQIGGVLYFFGSELATLRLFRKIMFHLPHLFRRFLSLLSFH